MLQCSSKLSPAPLPLCMQTVDILLLSGSAWSCSRFPQLLLPARSCAVQVLLQNGKVSSFVSFNRLSYKTLQPASSVSQCVFVTSLRYKEEEEEEGTHTQIILQNRKTKETESAPRGRMREGMSNARRLLNTRPGREREREK